MDANFYFNTFSIPVILAGFITLALGLMAYGKGNKQGELYFSFLMFACFGYSVFYTLEISSISLPWMTVFIMLEYTGATLLGPFLLLFVLNYTLRFNWINRRVLFLLFFIPAIHLLLVFTNPLHHLFYVSFVKVNNGYYIAADSEKGIFYWTHQAYSVLMVLISNLLLVRMLFNIPRAYLSQVLIVLLGSLCSASAYVLYLFKAIPQGLDPVPFSFALSGIVIYLGLFKFGLFRIMPVAFQSLFNNMADGVVVSDASGLLVAVNKAAMRLLRLPGRNLGVPVDQVLFDWPEIVQLIFSQEPVQGVMLSRNKETPWWLSVDCLPNIHNGVFLGMIIFLRDVTLRYQHEQSILEKQRLTDEQNTRLRSFTYIVSHNIRSHSANMSGLVQALKTADNEEERSLYLHLLDTSTQRLDETIRNLNEIISVTDLPVQQLRENRLLCQEVDKTLDVLRNSLQSSKINVRNLVPANLALCVVPAYLDSILINLISNAIRYRSETREPWIEISARHLDSRFVELEVRDNGLGIDLEKHGDKLFGMYKTFHRNAEARGFGLFLTKTQIEAMGGSISVESVPDQGSCFRVLLPETRDHG